MRPSIRSGGFRRRYAHRRHGHDPVAQRVVDGTVNGLPHQQTIPFHLAEKGRLSIGRDRAAIGGLTHPGDHFPPRRTLSTRERYPKDSLVYPKDCEQE